MGGLFSNIFRLFTIFKVIGQYRLHDLFPEEGKRGMLRRLGHLNPWSWFAKTDLTPGARTREALDALGPIFVKFGQTLSTRRDLIPDEIAIELSMLQDHVVPFSGVEAREQIEKALKQPIENIFEDFNPEALASASIAQVHTAILKENQCRVVVKVLRPRIQQKIKRDVALLYGLAKTITYCWPSTHRFRLIEIVREFENTLLDELDLTREAANASQLKRNFKNSKLLRIPEVYWPYIRRNVLVMERIDGIPIGNMEALRACGTNLRLLAERGVEIFFTQVFQDSFFHADMHPGNIFVDATAPDDPRYIIVDFGIVGSLNKTDQMYLAKNFLAFFHRNYRRVAELHVESGWAPPDTRIDQFEAAIRSVCEPMFERPLRDISYGQLLMRLFQTASRFQIEIQPQLTLLQKTLLNVEGLGRQLYPDLDLWSTAKPFLQRWVRSRVGVRAIYTQLKDLVPDWQERLPEIPLLVYRALSEHSKPKRTEPSVSGKQTQPAVFIAFWLLGFVAFLGYLRSQNLSLERWEVILVAVSLLSILSTIFGNRQRP